MADIVSPEVRSRMMAGIRGKDTKPEIILRKLLHRNAFRYRLHRRDLPGKPDIVFAGRKTVIFVNGCYWHGHENCHLFRVPSSRSGFWSDKISANRVRDQRNYDELGQLGWNVIVAWECAITKKQKLPAADVLKAVEAAMRKDCQFTEIRGQ